ncbi:anti-repressor SinI [Oceanobacillus picturae]|uniref:Anti-repressor SinI n=1 Tax=Oceanobacillus picturae TaxID=171693 RepID=W9AJV5_9BACI|nr:DNA-binding anti-repressor SinI [Oceanobacillus picturae]GAQ18572.1 anti-repressor SinI [Oceanobacillus picturae]CDO03177.1 Anti-repressor SinI [Oceanobacillus picturae]
MSWVEAGKMHSQELEIEWVLLIKEAKQLELTKDEIRNYLRGNKSSEEKRKDFLRKAD